MSIAELRQLPAAEKLKIVEALWSDLTSNEAAFVSPAWHEEELRNTEAEFIKGNVESSDWGKAKEELRKQFE